MGKKISKILKGQVTISLFYILLGLCLVLMPVATVDVLCKVVFGLAMIGAGAYHVYCFVSEKENCTVLDLFSGVIVLVLGGFLFTNPQIVVKLLPLLLGAFVLVDSIWSLRGAYRLMKKEREAWKILLFGSLIFVALGIAMVIWPFKSVRAMILFSGCVILGNGIVDVVFFVLLHKGMKERLEAAEEKKEAPTASAEEPKKKSTGLIPFGKKKKETDVSEPAAEQADDVEAVDADYVTAADADSAEDAVAEDIAEAMMDVVVDAEAADVVEDMPAEEPLEEWKD